MNYNSVILVGCFVVTAGWWFIHGIWHYPGPKLIGLYLEDADSTPNSQDK
jgi:choline transport protein